ncbi:hypothetical protein FDW83_12040 [Pseudarthrobacter sp. NamE2]|uniref:hypothetical protein n=1 Tax=Pseudarthrobacter sp. NamE2 TaxID=2576838 RepID=UPI0010FD9862|nr:hypothetical protein [Pseudarthrobacter sp. NamE2]TLM82677.1 hypothetical protein FDW83_12040 [Pseudarthrobacter sp. NamE2]
MKNRTLRHPFLSNTRSSRNREARTGEHCPLTGWWAPGGDEAEALFVAEGSIMPSRLGHSTSWSLVSGGLASGQLASASAGGAQ